jgi:hypothetical protein
MKNNNILLLLFLLFNFIIACISDIVLNILSRNINTPIIKSLHPYFEQKGVIKASLLAGLTVLVGVLITILFTKSLFNILIPNSFKQLILFIITGFLVGITLDILIYKYQVFGNTLNDYYNIAGAGILGGLALVFTLCCSFGILWTMKKGRIVN